jgi:hypothetical protein
VSPTSQQRIGRVHAVTDDWAPPIGAGIRLAAQGWARWVARTREQMGQVAKFSPGASFLIFFPFLFFPSFQRFSLNSNIQLNFKSWFVNL